MTFLRPELLWALPLVLVPVLIHLINRLRHRPMPWAAMAFLLQASRSSTRRSRMRHWLVLAARTLAVLMLILLLGRPLVGGWLGWGVSSAPDTVLLVLDRSASMQATLPGGRQSRLQEGVRFLADASAALGGSGRVALLDTASREVTFLPDPGLLAEWPSAMPTETAADLPATLDEALRWLVDSGSGRAEIWIASDLQDSSWKSADGRWGDLRAQMEALPQPVGIRLWSPPQDSGDNASLTGTALLVRSEGGAARLELDLLIRCRGALADRPPVLQLVVEGRTQPIPVETLGSRIRLRRSIPWDADRPTWGRLELEPDANPADNVLHFVAHAPAGPEVWMVGESVSGESQALRAAAEATLSEMGGTVRSLGWNEWADLKPDALTLLAWMGPLPAGSDQELLDLWASKGIPLVFIPPEETSDQSFLGVSWSPMESAGEGFAYPWKEWTRDEGPLADGPEGLALPVRDVLSFRRAVPRGTDARIWAVFEDDEPALVSRRTGSGSVYFLGTRPSPQWSSLGDGYVLVPMVARWIEEGLVRLGAESSWACGQLDPVMAASTWRPLDPATASGPALASGVYESGEDRIAVNVPAEELEETLLDGEQALDLLGPSARTHVDGSPLEGEDAPGEAWRLFLLAMLAFLFLESWLVLPPAPAVSAAREGGRA